MTLTKVSYAASFILLASTALSSAAVITQTESFGPATTNWGTSTGGTGFTPTQPLPSFAGFNTSLGTLTSVIITATDAISGQVNLTNNGTTTTDVSAQIVNTAKANVPGLTSPSFTITDASTSYTQTLAGGASSGNQPVLGTAHVSSTITSPSILPLYETSWTATAGDHGSVSVSSGNGNGSATYIDNGTITVKASYVYTPFTTPSVPEPAGVALLGVGIAGVGVIRRRRKA